MDKPVEVLLFEFLQEQIAAAVPEDVLYEVDLHDTTYQAINDKKPRGFRITSASSDPAPEPGGGLKEFDADLLLICFARVQGKDQKQRIEAMTEVYQLQTAVLKLMFADSSLGGRVCDVFKKRVARDYDSMDGNPYAVSVIPLIINPTGYQNAGS